MLKNESWDNINHIDVNESFKLFLKTFFNYFWITLSYAICNQQFSSNHWITTGIKIFV